VSLLLDEGPRTEPGGRGSRVRRRLALGAALVALAAVAAVLVAEGRDHGPRAAAEGRADALGPRSPAAARGGARTPDTDRWDGYAERAAPRRERLKLELASPPAAGLVFDVRTGRVLWARRPRTRRPIASLTKMMTALLVADTLAPGATVPVTRESLDSEGSAVGMFRRGQRIDADTMLYGLLLPSGNDAAIALAQRVAGTVKAFVARMNTRARALGLTCTRFSSPSGILDRGNHSCARDLARMAVEVLRRPLLRTIVGSPTAVRRLPSGRPRKLYMSNHNTLMTRGYGGVTGVKTGYTDAAGMCLVATVRRGGRHLGVVLLDSPDTGAQGALLLDAAFARVQRG
jgi:serine-type D-Ala-D-Ala carboxypeptidase (penicillin-binding protein 5/6)